MFDEFLKKPGNILAPSALFPLGRKVGLDVEEEPCYQMLHPSEISDKHHINMFAGVKDGDEIELLRGSEETLVSEISDVCHRLMLNQGFSSSDIKGALVIYCAGCMLASKPHIPRVVKRLNHALNNAPFIGTFNFGEQGRYPNGQIGHGNLMFSVLLFSSRSKAVLKDNSLKRDSIVSKPYLSSIGAGKAKSFVAGSKTPMESHIASANDAYNP
jgi:hypothetical protein